MFRGSRRPVVLLLWLLLALLPLRGWAQGTMAMAAPEAPAQALPCHGDMAAHSASHSDSQDTTSPTCSHCDLCHAAAVPNAPALQAADALPDLAPAARPARAPAAAQADSLFRPPRP